MKFAVISDVHYIAPETIINDEKSTINSTVSRHALYEAASQDDIDTILITGDLTDHGDRTSHLALIEILRDIRKKGKRIFVTTATHDFYHNRMYTRRRGDTDAEFNDKPWERPYFDPEKEDLHKYMKNCAGRDKPLPVLEECCTPGELWEMYREFGRDEACSVSDESYSYCVDLDEDTRCLMLNDNFRNVEALHDISVTYSPACFKWIKENVDKAKKDGKFIFICTHHPLLPPSPAYRVGAGNRDMRSPYSVHTLADIGINLAFTGHTHFSDVGFAESSKGNLLCDISTPSVRYYPPRYRIVDLDGKNHRISCKCISVSKPDEPDIYGSSLEDYYRRELYNDYFMKVKKLKSPLDKIITGMKIKDLYFLCKKESGLTPGEYESVKNTTVFDLITGAAFNMLTGDGKYTPDTPEYKILMGLSAVLDSIIDAQPFYDVKKKYLKGYSVREIIEPLCFNNFIPDNNADFDFTLKPEKNTVTPEIRSFAGEYLMTALCITAVPLAYLLPYAAVVGLPAVTIKKRLGIKSKKSGPEYRY